MTKIANGAAYFFIGASLVLTLISVAGIWGVFSGNVITKSFESLGLIAFASIVMMMADGFSTRKSLTPQEVVANNGSIEGFKGLRSVALGVLIISVSICVCLGLLSIWDVVVGDILFLSISTMGTVGFYSLVTALVCSKRISDMRGVSSVSSAAVATQPVQTSAPIQAEVPPAPAPVAPFNPSA
jgi:hypothetical protein